MTESPFEAIAISLGLGLLVGLQREWKESEMAGIRTFPLISLLGTLCALATSDDNQWVVAAGLLAITLLLVVSNLSRILREENGSHGITTEVAALLTFMVGAAVGFDHTIPAVVVGGILAVLLQWKQRLHGLVDRIGETDIRALTNLVLIALVILPILPDRTFGPYDVLNPYNIWLMVVLIVGISLTAYIAYQLLDKRAGALLGGIFGGLISSTATTVSYARQTKALPELSTLAAVVVLVASTVVNVRILVEIGVVAPELLKSAFLPFAAVMLLMIVECGAMMVLFGKTSVELPAHKNPAQLKPAIAFAALYAVVLFVVAAAKHHLGSGALYGVAMISGLTNIDAITISTAELFRNDRVEADTAWRVILVAMTSNLVFKIAATAFLGSRRLAFHVLIVLGIAIMGCLALLYWWPHSDPGWIESWMQLKPEAG